MATTLGIGRTDDGNVRVRGGQRHRGWRRAAKASGVDRTDDAMSRSEEGDDNSDWVGYWMMVA